MHKRRDCNITYGANVTEVDTEDRRHGGQDAASQLYLNH